MEMKVNDIDRVRKYVSIEGKENRMCIAIDYNEKEDTWKRYKFYYNKNMEISDILDEKTLHSLEEVNLEMITICEYYGSIDYMAYYDNEGYKKELYKKELYKFMVY